MSGASPRSGSGHVYFSNVHYQCYECGRDLWTKRARALYPDVAPAMFIGIDDHIYCHECIQSRASNDTLEGSNRHR